MILNEVLGSAIGAAVTWAVFGVLGYLWGKRKLLHELERHKLEIAELTAQLVERDKQVPRSWWIAGTEEQE